MPRVTEITCSALDTFISIVQEISWLPSRRGSLTWMTCSRDTWEVMEIERERRAEWRRHKQHLAYLRRLKLMESRIIGDRLEVKLTDKGYACFLKEQIKRTPESPSGNILMVIFDIPESERFLRQMFRRFLKECGFIQLQKSVWITRKDVGSLLSDFVIETKLTAWVHVLASKMLSGDVAALLGMSKN